MLRSIGWKLALIASLVCLPAAAAQAQGLTILVTPTSKISFTASPDHNTTFGGNAVVTSYKAVYCLQSSPTSCPITVPLGKPTPDATNTITVSNVFGSLLPNTEYTAKVIATGPGGDSPASSAPDPFGVAGPPAAPANVAIKQ